MLQWCSKEYEGLPFKEDSPELYTDRGERVRSKSEVIIANLMAKENIPYKYECPLYLNGFGTVHPDFTALNVRERKEYYWEHLGMMEDPEYSEKAVRKISAYIFTPSRNVQHSSCIQIMFSAASYVRGLIGAI